MQQPLLLLASNSPRRRELIELTGLPFRVRPVEEDETPLPGEPPRAYVLRLAEAKARRAAGISSPGELILAADTVVADGLSLLGKPASNEDAIAMLLKLRGRDHQVFTALAVYDPAAGLLETALCVSRVPMRNYTLEEIAVYVATGDPRDKAGAYAIQHPVFHPVENFSHCYASVMGLPLCHMVLLLHAFAVFPTRDVPAACQSHLDYDCPVSASILAARLLAETVLPQE